MFCRLSRFCQASQQIFVVGRDRELREADVTGDDGKNIIQVMCNPASQRAERLELTGGQSIFFRPLTLSHVAKERRDAPAARIRMYFEPLLAGRIARFELDRLLLFQYVPIIFIKRSTAKFWKLF